MLLILLIVLTCSGSVTTQSLHVYKTFVDGPSPLKNSLQCVRSLVREQTESAKISTAGECTPLSRSWLETKTVDPGFTYVTGKVKDLQYQPPMSVTSTTTRFELPGLLGVGSSVDVSFSFPGPDTDIYVILSMDGGNDYLKAVVEINNQKVKLDYRINKIWQKNFVTAEVPLAVDVVYKLTLKPHGNGTYVYMNDDLLIDYNHPDNPFFPVDAQRIIFNAIPNTGMLHRLKIIVTS